MDINRKSIDNDRVVDILANIDNDYGSVEKNDSELTVQFDDDDEIYPIWIWLVSGDDAIFCNNGTVNITSDENIRVWSDILRSKIKIDRKGSLSFDLSQTKLKDALKGFNIDANVTRKNCGITIALYNDTYKLKYRTYGLKGSVLPDKKFKDRVYAAFPSLKYNGCLWCISKAEGDDKKRAHVRFVWRPNTA